MKKEELEQKLFEERVEVCLVCDRVMDCGHVAEYEDCEDFKET